MNYYIYLFLIYAFLGWIIEVTFVSLKQGRFINRGFMLGPVIPIYSCGGLLMTIFLKGYVNDYVALFIMSAVLCGTLEYIVSYVSEKIFNLRWWDYSNNKLNINGRITLSNLVLFGILGTFNLKLINPYLLNLFNKYNSFTLSILLTIFGILFLTDFISSFILTYNVKLDIKGIYADSTEEIKKQIKEKYLDKLLKRRIITAFPDFIRIKKD